jgi:hypothetical protein
MPIALRGKGKAAKISSKISGPSVTGTKKKKKKSKKEAKLLFEESHKV